MSLVYKNRITFCGRCNLLFNFKGKSGGSVDGEQFEWHEKCNRIVLYNKNDEFIEAITELLYVYEIPVEIGKLIATFIQ